MDWKHSRIAEQTGIDTAEPWLQEMLLNSLMSTEYFCRTFLNETFWRKMTWQQKEAFKVVDDDTIPKAVECCFRGWGKSSIAESKIIQGACFRRMPHAMVVGSNEGLATDTTENIKTELLTNQLIRETFGSFKPKTGTDLPLSFSKKAYYLVDPKTGRSFSIIHPKGARQKVRGVRAKVGGKTYRPFFIYVDDLEDDEEVLNGDTRLKVENWFHASLLQCVSQERPNPKTDRWDKPKDDPFWLPPWRVLYTDTLKHPDANIAHIMADDEWVSRTFPQAEFRLDSDGKRRLYSLVPEIVSTQQVRREYKAAKSSPGRLQGYYQEKLCKAMAEEDAQWQKEMFHYYSEAAAGDGKSMFGLNKDPELHRFLIVDPARTAKSRSCPSAILAVATDYNRGRVYFRKTIARRMSQDALLDTAFATAFDMNTKVIGVEITGLGDAGKWMWMNYASQHGYKNIEFVWLEGTDLPKGDWGAGDDAAKRARTSQGLPLYQKHMVYHEESLRGGILETMELSFPLCSQWDIMDCMGYVPTMLHMAGRVFATKQPGPHEAPLPKWDDDQWEEITQRLRQGSWRRV